MHARRSDAPGGAHRDCPGVASWLAAATLLALAVPVMFVSAFGVYYFDDPGLARLRNMAPGLTVSAVIGLGTATVIRWLLGGPLPVWLLLGVAPALVAGLNHAGLIR